MKELDDFVSAAQKANDAIFSNMGLTINASMLDTYHEYKKRRATFYGTHWLSRFWCQKIRPWFLPTSHAIIGDFFRAADARHKQAYLNAVLEMGEKENARS